MPFVPNYQYDVFLSYRQADNKFDWVTQVDQTIRKLLEEQRRPAPGEPAWQYEIFRDDAEIGGNVVLGDRIKEAVTSAALLVVVMSDNYLANDSDWCAKELQEFRKATAGKPLARERIFVVHRNHVELLRRPADLREYVGYRLWEQDAKTDFRQPISFDFKTAGRVPVDCQRLGTEMFQALCKLRTAPTAPTTTVAARPATTILLAEVTDELHRDRTGFYTFLEQEGFRVVPAKGRQYRNNPADAETELVPLLAESTLVVQMLGKDPIPSDDGFGRGVESWLVDKAKAAGKKAGLDLLRWRRQGTKEEDLVDPEHRAFAFTADVIAEDIEQFKQSVVKKARELTQRWKVVVGKPGAKVLVTSKKEHRKQADDVADVIDMSGLDMAPDPIEASIIDPGVPLQVVTKEFEDQQSSPMAMVVIHADGDETWVQARMQECRRYQLSRRSNPPPCAVVVDPPDDEPHPKATPARFEVIRQSDPAALTAFLAKLGKGAG